MFQVLYLIPTMDQFTSKLLGDIIKDNDNKIQSLNNEIQSLKKMK